jgi:hypothetical protein
MKETKEEYYSLQDIANTLKAFMNHLLRKWWILVIAVIVGGVLGAGYYFTQKSKYEAVTTFILEEKSASGSGLAGLASQFGFNLGSLSGSGNLFAGDNILDILKSKKVVQQVLLSQVDSTTHNRKSLADYYLEFTGIMRSWQQKPLLANINLANVKNQITPLQDSILNVVYERITKKNLVAERTRKQGSIIKVQVTAQNCLFARLMSERLVEEAAKLYLDIRVGTAQENIRQLQRRSDTLLLLLNSKSYTTAASQPLDVNPGVRIATVPVEIATRDKTVLATLYGEVTKNLEASKLLLSQQTPVIQLLDSPSYLLVDKKKGLFFLLFVFSIVAGIIYASGAFLRFLFFEMASKAVNIPDNLK